MPKHFTRRLCLSAALACCASGRVWAAEAEKSGKKGDDTIDLTRLELPSIALPISRDGRLVNYVFGSIQIQVAETRSADFLRTQSFLLRDAIVRVGANLPVQARPKPENFDRVGVTRIVLQAVERVKPGTRILKVTFIDAALMRP
ncbi:MAG: hypothetical protein RL186_221 [Pseudomonadota bacterium]|jgi:hypothetical protein